MKTPPSFFNKTHFQTALESSIHAAFRVICKKMKKVLALMMEIAFTPHCHKRHDAGRTKQNRKTENMKASDLISLAAAKGYGISRTSSNHYQTHCVVNGIHITKDFFGTWADFVKHIKNLAA